MALAMLSKISSRTLIAFSAGAALAPLVRLLRHAYLRLRDGPPALALPLAFSTCRIHRIRSLPGLRYKLSVSLPHGYDDAAAKSQRYPVLVALDAEPYLFPLLTVVARTNKFFAKSVYFPDAIVIGVVADLESEPRFHSRGRLDVPLCWQEQRPTRARDYLPTAAESPWGAPGAPSVLEVSGHTTEFVDFLCDVALPFVDATYRTRGSDARALIGKSFGGSGVAAAMIHERGAKCFSEFVLGSPSIAWDDNAWFRLEAAARAAAAPTADAIGSPPYGADVFVCHGAEKDGDPELFLRFKSVLDSRRGPRGLVDLEAIAGETHGSVSYPFVHHAFEWLKPRWAAWDAAEGDEKARRVVEEWGGRD